MSNRILIIFTATTLLAGCAAIRQANPALTEADFATIKPGMTRDEVLRRFGPPTWSFGVRQENMTVMNYRFNRNDCTIYQVSVLPDGIVHDASLGADPACDRPERRRF
jgi:hypothetical protein